MKLFCLLMLFVLANVSTNNQMEYLSEIVITNALIEIAYKMNNCTVEDNFIANGLEHVVKKIVFKDKHLSDRMNLNFMNHMIVVPEFPFLGVIDASLELEDILKQEIIDELKIKVPEIPSENFTKLDFTQRGDERRCLVGKALKNIICKAIDFENLTKLLEERRRAPTVDSRQRIIRASDRNLYQVSVKIMCRLLSLFLCTKCPTQELFCLKDEDKNTCTIINTRSTPEKHVYREIDGIWYQVSNDDIDYTIEPLKSQIC
ncbi:uncharacterized protein LOC126835652 [Adelges cooleyi]|uniref:uncharacterized protein LOC126835652 n=1 Tax=Adelges cooleyi TaxID=133065 RepID=UPI00218065EC|nr:uncharacterized protein LOC126835652 [Adelges cooleyi]